MVRRHKDPLRPLTPEERAQLEQIARAKAWPAAQVARAKALLAVADGHAFTQAARAAGRKSGDAVGRLVARFNREGLAAVPGHGGGPPPLYGVTERESILACARRAPDREKDRTATWSLTTLQQALRPEWPTLSTYTIWCVLLVRPAGASCTRRGCRGRRAAPGARPGRCGGCAGGRTARRER